MIKIVTRRDFLRRATLAVAGLAGAAAGFAPSEVFAEEPRAKAWRLLEESRILHEASGQRKANEQTLVKMEQLFRHLDKHFSPPNPLNYDADVAEVRVLLKDPQNFTLETCSDATFCIVIVRHGMRNLKLPLIQARNWRPFARHFTKLVMAA